MPVIATTNGHLPTCHVRVELLPAAGGEVLVLHIAGEIDMATEHKLEAALTGCLDTNPRHLVVDLSAVSFCAVRGLRLIRGAAARAAAATTWFAVSGLSAVSDRVTSILWEPGRPNRYCTVAAAVTALGAEQYQNGDAPRD